MVKNIIVKFRDIIINVSIIVVGILVAIAVFALLRNIDQQKERETLLPRSREALKNQEYSQAINLFLKSDKEFPNNTEVERSLGDLYFLKGKYDDSLKYYQSISESDLIKSDYQKIGEIYYQKNNFDKVLETWKDRDLEPRQTYQLAKIYYDRDDLVNYFAQLLKIQQYREPLALSQINESNLSTILTNTSKIVDAPSIADEVLNIDLFKSQIVEAKKQLDLGKKDFSDLIQVSAFSNLNQCRSLDSKISTLRKTLEIKKIPTYQVDYYQGNCLNQTENPDQAIPLIENAIKNDSTVIEYREALAKSYFLKKDPEKVKQIFSEILVLQKAPVYYQNLAVYLYKLDLIDESLTNYDLAFSLQQNDIEKEKTATTILQINLRDKSNLDICQRSEILDLMNNDNNEELLIKGHCNIYLKKDLGLSDTTPTLTSQYLESLNIRDRKEIDKVLDKDPDGLITIYFKTVGVKLIR